MASDDILARAAELGGLAPPDPDELPESPARRPETGRIRNVKSMGDEKLQALVYEMEAYKEADPDAYEAVLEEAENRGLSR